ncbi:MAG: phosphate acyltransferase, partial [Candidatus Sumerlaeota bacterium]|nr:phosphate acyltransferase [Candidatus Sumerlaeota bacterium]
MADRSRKIALDAMGSDDGPASLVGGALAALGNTSHDVILVGREEPLKRLLAEEGYSLSRDSRISIVPASDVITMRQTPKEAVRNRNSSIHVAAQLVREGKADGLVSAGHTGVTMAVTKLMWRSLPGVSRPAIATVIPSRPKPCVLLDIGA